MWPRGFRSRLFMCWRMPVEKKVDNTSRRQRNCIQSGVDYIMLKMGVDTNNKRNDENSPAHFVTNATRSEKNNNSFISRNGIVA